MGFEEAQSESNLFEELNDISLGQYLSQQTVSSTDREINLINANFASLDHHSGIDQKLKLGLKDIVLGHQIGIHTDNKHAILNQLISADAGRLYEAAQIEANKEQSLPSLLIKLSMKLYSRQSQMERTQVEVEMVKSVEKVIWQLSEQDKHSLIVGVLENLQSKRSEERRVGKEC